MRIVTAKRKVGRPRTLPESQKAKGFVLRMSDDEREAVQAAAARDGVYMMSRWLRGVWQREAADPTPLDPESLRPGDWKARLSVSMSDDERAVYEAAAKRAGVPLSTWLRAVGVRAAQGGKVAP